ncbi:MAG: CHASE2 domain-containing protein [Opitutales bacterium]
MNRFKQFLPYPALLLLAVGTWVGLWGTGALSGLEQEAMRWRYVIRGEMDSEAPIVYVDLDALSIAKIGDKPWDYLNFAQVLQGLLGPGGARAVGVDIIFSNIGGGALIDVDKARKGRMRLGQVVEAYEDRIVLAAAYTGTTGGFSGLPLKRKGFDDPAEVPFPEAPTFPVIRFDSGRLGLANVDEDLSEGAVPQVVLGVVDTEGADFSRHLIDGQLRHFTGLLEEPRVLEEAGKLKLVDADGFPTASVPKESRHRLLSLGLAVFLAAHGLDAEAVEWEEEALRIFRDGELFREVPLEGGQSIRVNWFEGWRSARTPHLSMAEVLDQANALGRAAREGNAARVGELEEWFERFKDKVVFLGPVDATLKDLAPTPFDRVPVPKVGVHANLYRTVQEEAYLVRASDTQVVLAVGLLATVVAGLALWSGAGARFTRIGAFGLLLLYVGAVFYVFGRAGFVLPLIAPVGASLSAALWVVLFKLGSEEWQRRRIKALFGAYVSPELVEEMVESQRDPELGGTEAEITALFSDVEGFSALSEQLAPNELVTLMNEYLSAMTDAQQAEGGTLDKYIGDAIVTMFGMPLPIPDHAARACQSALRMQERHAELRARWAQAEGWPKQVLRMRTRIGINTGRAVIGNMGSRVRFNYTMMGDSVNLAARCESGAKSYGVYTMVTDATICEALKTLPDLFYRKLDRIVVKGRSQPVEVFELWDASVAQADARACRELYHAGLECYFAGDFDAAAAKFREALPHEPARRYAPTTPSTVLLARCEEFLANGAPERWDGAYRMRTK